MKHLKHLFTALLLLLSVAVNAHDFEVGGIYYNITDATNKTVEVTYKGSSYYEYSNEYTGNVVIPESVAYNGSTYSVTSIGNDAFFSCDGLTSVEIPNSVTGIGNQAFEGCTSLKDLRIEDGEGTLSLGYNSSYEGLFYDCPLETLYLGRDLSYNTDGYYGYSPFYGKSTLKSVTIGNSVTSIGEYAFLGCSGLTSIEIPNSVTSIGDWAFYDCSGLTSIVIGNSVTSIGDFAFCGCSGLTSIVVAEGNAKYDSRENCNAIIETATNALVAGCKNTIIPNSVTSIGEDAFRDCSGLTSIVIPNSVTSIGGAAFYGCSGLTSVVIPNSVTSIGSSAFSGCSGLKSIVVAEGNAKYDSRENCNAIIETATNALVAGCKNTIIPNSVTSIGKNAFSYCSGLTSIEIPNSVTSIGGAAFAGCSGLTSIEIPNSVTSIGNQAFYGCSGLTCIEIPNSVTSIGYGAFRNCSGLTSVEIPNSVTSIGSYAFSGCFGLASVVIGNSVTSIGDDAFNGCSGLKTVINLSSLTITKGSSSNGYIGYYADKVINAPNGTIEGDFVFGIIDGVNTLVAYLGNDTEIVLPDNYSKGNYAIGEAFRDNTSITSIVIPNSVTSIGGSAFYNCSGLTSVEIPNSVTTIATYAFYNCNNVESLYIGNSIQQIGDYAFEGCNNLFDIKVANKKVIIISDNVFSVDSYNNAILYVPKGRSIFYKNTTPWNNLL